jgi:hypothetical protein
VGLNLAALLVEPLAFAAGLGVLPARYEPG